MTTLLVILILLIPTFTHLIFDYHKMYSGGKIRHWLSASIAVLTSVVVGITVQKVDNVFWWQGTIFALAIHFAFFDPLWNWANHHKWHYNGDRTNPERAFTDRMWDRVPIYVQPFVRLWVLYVGYAFYFELGKIITYIP